MSELGVARDLQTSDLHVEVIDLLANRVESEIGIGFFVAVFPFWTLPTQLSTWREMQCTGS